MGRDVRVRFLTALIGMMIAGAFPSFAQDEGTAVEPHPAGQSGETMAPIPTSPTTPPVHDGFYLQFGLGLGYFNDSGKVETFVSEYGVNTSGPALSVELSIGGAIQPGVAMGGALLVNRVIRPQIRQRGETHSEDSVWHSMLGPFIDIYPNPHGGFHTGATLGYSIRSIDDASRGVSEATAHGFGFAPHVGYGWWEGESWSFGLIGRFTYAHLAADVTDGLPTGIQRSSVTVATIQATATYF